jgi:hypothetical protein
MAERRRDRAARRGDHAADFPLAHIPLAHIPLGHFPLADFPLGHFPWTANRL